MTEEQLNRSEILGQLSQNLSTWNGSSETATEIIKKNEILLIRLKKVDLLLSKEETKRYNKKEQHQVATIIEGQQSLLTVIKKDRAAILDKMKQMNQKNKVVDNYYTSFQQPIFVDRGM